MENKKLSQICDEELCSVSGGVSQSAPDSAAKGANDLDYYVTKDASGKDVYVCRKCGKVLPEERLMLFHLDSHNITSI